MTEALYWFVLCIISTGVMWMPYGFYRPLARGFVASMGYSASEEEATGWAERAKRAHRNATENLVLLTALVLTHHLVNQGQEDLLVARAVQAYFFFRWAHYFIYLAKISYLRTILFCGCYVSMVTIVLRLLSFI